LVTNTANEIGAGADQQIRDALMQFTQDVKQVFREILSKDNSIDFENIEKLTDFLIISMFGLSSATRIFTQKQLDNYIENIFLNK